MEIIDFIVSQDIKLFVFLNSFGSESFDSIWLFLTNKFTWIPFYVYLLYLVYKYSDVKTLLFYIVLVAITITIVDQSTNHLFKNFFERLRPSHNPDLEGLIRIPGSKGGLYGFVSAHASNTFAIASLLGFFLKDIFPKSRNYLILWAALVSYSRIYVGVHYPLDIICGALWGLVISGTIIFILKKSTLVNYFKLAK